MSPPLHRRGQALLGTIVEIAVSSIDRMDLVDQAVTAAFEVIARVHKLLSFQDPDSDLSRLNASDGRWVPLHPVALRALGLGRSLTALSGGLFDCTVGGALVARGVLPDHGRRAPLIRGVADDIELAAGAGRLRRPILVTLDGVAKGLAVDLAVARLRRAGVGHGIIEAGGDLRVFGGVPLPVHRRELDGRLTALGQLTDGAIATSWTGPLPDERRPAWIVGQGESPVAAGLHSVLARMAWRADALTKVAASAPQRDRGAAVTRLRGRLIHPKAGSET